VQHFSVASSSTSEPARRVSAMSTTLLKTILESAIKIEEESYDLYTKSQGKVNLASSKALLSELAQAEIQHKKKLLTVMNDPRSVSQLGSPTGRVEDLKIVDFMEDTAVSEDADYQAILIFAAKREKSTYEHYRSLATGLFARYYPIAGQLFSRLAEEELIHKNRLEREYDDVVLKED